jgi:branched-chain amino acid transport system permease protein
MLAVLTYSMALSLRLGTFSIAPIGFAGVGGYIFAIAAVTLHWATPTAIGFAVLVSALIGFVLSIPLARIRGLYTAIGTLAFVIIANSIEGSLDITGGPFGLAGLPVNNVQLPLAALVAVAALTFWWLDSSQVGKLYDVAGHDQVLAATLGVSVRRFRIAATVIGAAASGFAGALSVQAIGFISPDGYTFFAAIEVAAFAILGGAKHWLGPVLATAVLGFIQISVRDLVGWADVIFGAVLVVVITFQPEGIAGFARRLLRPRIGIGPQVERAEAGLP